MRVFGATSLQNGHNRVQTGQDETVGLRAIRSEALATDNLSVAFFIWMGIDL